MKLLLSYLVLINAIGLVIMLADKLKAKAGAWRIPEATLMGVAAIGGCFGALAGMYLFRHKTRHPKFSVGLPVLCVLYVLLLGWLALRLF